jgi:aminoglycoside phosphotransferase (APT) family kinase protein
LDGVSPFDPLRRIRPRLDLLTDVTLQTTLGRLARAVPTGGALIHGDFHLGQVICDAEGGGWLVDLDDLEIGPVEADLGNLIANLATQPTLTGPFAARLQHWRHSILEAARHLGQNSDPGRVDHFTALALIRRHLKLREQARRDFEADIAAWVTPVACQTSPSGNAAYPG